MGIDAVLGPVAANSIAQGTSSDTTLQIVSGTSSSVPTSSQDRKLVFYPSVRRIPDPKNDTEPLVLFQSEYLKYFADLTNKDKVLNGLYEVLKQGRLFVRRKSPDSLYYGQYIDLLKSIVLANKEYFSGLNLKPINETSTNFKEEFIKLRIHPNLTELQKAFLLTEAVFLALNNINPVDPMVRVRKSRIEKISPVSGKEEIMDHTIGGRNEIRALTLLLLFNEEIQHQKDIKMSTYVSTYKRHTNKKTGDIFIIKPKERFDSEVDFRSENCIGSIKSRYKRLEEPLAKLFFRIVDDEALGLKHSLSKLILVRVSDDGAQLSTNYMDSNDYKKLKNMIIDMAKQSINQSETPPHLKPKEYKFYLDEFISNDRIDIFLIPGVDDYRLLEIYMGERFEQLDEKTKALIA